MHEMCAFEELGMLVLDKEPSEYDDCNEDEYDHWIFHL